MSRKKREYSTESKENYLRFMKDNNLSESELSFSKYKKNLDICNWMYVEYALSTGQKVSLPYGFGPLAVNKKMLKRFKVHEGKKYVNLRPDWKLTKANGKMVYHTNEHTDGYNFSWIWFPGEAKIHLNDLYVFKPGRYASRAITKYVNKPNSTYKEMYMEWAKIK